MNKKPILNSFEKKSLLFGFKDLKILNLNLYVDHFSKSYYHFYIERHGLIFNFPVFFSSDNKPEISQFSNDARFKLDDFVSTLDSYLGLDRAVGKQQIKPTANFLYRTIMSQFDNYRDAGFSIRWLTPKEEKKLERKCRTLLVQGQSPASILKSYFIYIGIFQDNMPSRIKAIKHRIEIEVGV